MDFSNLPDGRIYIRDGMAYGIAIPSEEREPEEFNDCVSKKMKGRDFSNRREARLAFKEATKECE